MTDTRNDPTPEASVPNTSLESILCTEELQHRPSRAPDYEKENRALVELMSALTDSPSTVLQTLAERILDITQCESAGLSLLTKDGKTPHVDGQRLYWPAICGMWNSHVGGGTPRNFSPCGDALDQNRTLLFTHFERRYPYLMPFNPAAKECLLVPFYVGGKAVGAIWGVMHSDRRKFDAEDHRVMASLGKFASSAYQTWMERTAGLVAVNESVSNFGILTASIAHEVNQPLSGVITNASTCLRMLSADPPNVDGARETARRTIRDGNRASEIIARLRMLYSKKEPSPESMNLNEATREVISLFLSELHRNEVILRLELADDLPLITGDRVQLQQVILNLLRNASDAMSTVNGREREMLIRTERDEGDQVRFSVKDTGIGFTPQVAESLFEAFYTTKSDGMGIGLSVSRSIVEAHHGRLWATQNQGPGATFSFSIPCAPLV